MQRKETVRGRVLYYLGGASAIAGIVCIGLTLRVGNTMGAEGMGTIRWLLIGSWIFIFIGAVLHRSQIKQS